MQAGSESRKWAGSAKLEVGDLVARSSGLACPLGSGMMTQTSLGQAMAKEARCPDPATAQPTMRPGDVVGLGPRWLPSLGLIRLEAEIVC